MMPFGSRNRSRAKARGSAASNCSASSKFIQYPSLRAQRSNPAGLPRRFAPRNDYLELRKRHALLPHIFAGTVGVADLARLVALQEQELARALVGVDLRRQRGGV